MKARWFLCFYIGIDIAKKKPRSFNNLILLEKSLSKSISFPNSTKGIEKFNNFIAEFGITTNNCIIGMEATGHYWISLFSYIVDLGFTCYVINPIQSDAFRKMYVRQTKNDSVDSFIIAQ